MLIRIVCYSVCLLLIVSCKNSLGSGINDDGFGSGLSSIGSGSTVHGIPIEQARKSQLIAMIQNGSDLSNASAIASANSSDLNSTSGGIFDPSTSTLDSNTQFPDSGFALLAGETAYMKECSAAGVPIPPAWGSPDWKYTGTLPKDRIFALDPDLITELWAYSDVLGSCAALPRMASDRSIRALGMICQGKSGKACFWDNVDPRTEDKITDPKGIRPEVISDGSNLRENCSECHRGQNVFIVHVGTALEKIPNRKLDKPYAPIGQRDWENPQANAAFAPSCQGCHSLPKLSVGYCDNVLLPSILGVADDQGILGKPTMPPIDEDPKDYAADIAEIKKACAKLP